MFYATTLPTYIFLSLIFRGKYSPERQIFLSPLANGKKLQDPLATLPLEQQKTFHDFTGAAWDAIDTIYCDRYFSVEQVIINRQQWEGVWPSDHFPVIVKLTLP